MDQYLAYELSSRELGEKTGFHPAAIRRAILRLPKDKPVKADKARMRAVRHAYWRSIAHLPTHQIKKLAHVSLSTAVRIKKERKEMLKEGAENAG